MIPNDTTPIPTTARSALDHIAAAAGEAGVDDGIDREAAVQALVAEGYPEVEARDQIAVLLDRGYLYAVGDELRITPPYS
jgi:hypothetical protein